MKISVIIVNYNTFELTSACIRSVIQFTTVGDYEIILVDNASTECDPEKFLQEFPGLVLVKSSYNAGFAAGNNLGIEKALGEYILLLNSDAYLREDSIGKSLHYFQSRKDIGVLGCRMTFPDGSIQHTARKFRSIGWELLDLFRFIPLAMPYRKRSRLMLGKYFRCDEDIECDWVNGAFFLFPGTLLDQFPGKKLDDRFFMYGGDQLWCIQVQEIGLRILFYAGTTIIHVGSASTDIKRQVALRKAMMSHELVIMRLRRGSGIYYYLCAAIYGFKEGMRNFAKMVIFKLSGRLVR